MAKRNLNETEQLKKDAANFASGLADFRIKADVVNYSPGPVITRFELNLAPGVKAARISNLSRDLARSLSTVAVRVVEVIPGKPYVGLELPNKKRQTVYLREVLDKMERHGFTALPMLNMQGKYIGTVTEGDLLWYLKEQGFPASEELEDVSITVVPRHRDNKAVYVHEKMESLLEKVTNQNFVPVVDDDKIFIGLVTRKDVLLHMAKKLELKK